MVWVIIQHSDTGGLTSLKKIFVITCTDLQLLVVLKKYSQTVLLLPYELYSYCTNIDIVLYLYLYLL